MADLADVVTAAIDPTDGDSRVVEVRDRALDLVDKMLANAERTLATGTPAERAGLTKSILPAILKELQASGDGGLGELKRAQAELMAAQREHLQALQGQVPAAPELGMPAADTADGPVSVPMPANIPDPRTTPIIAPVPPEHAPVTEPKPSIPTTGEESSTDDRIAAAKARAARRRSKPRNSHEKG